MTTEHPPPRAVALLLKPGWIIPIEPSGVVLDAHALVVDRGVIVDLLPTAVAVQRYRAREVLELPGQVLLPGLINVHTHAAMTLLRGYADDLPLMRWLEERIWPAEARHADAAFVEAGTLLACAEMLRGGVTCFNDMYFFPEAAAAAARRAGIRAALGLVVIEFPTAYAKHAAEYLAKGQAFAATLCGEPLLSACWAPHAPYTVSDASFEAIRGLAEASKLPIHLHVHETQDEIQVSLKAHGVRPLERLARLGIVSPQLIAVHAVHLLAEEIALLAEAGAHVAHCPTSNLKLGSGIAPIANLLRAGSNVGLGTDGAASNNRLDVFHEMRHAALLAKGASGDATAMSAHAVLRAATLSAAEALGLAANVGSLMPGKAADLCSIGMDDWLLGPCFDPASHVVYVAGREQVRHVWVAGNQRVKDGKLVDIPDGTLLEIIDLWHNRLKS